MSFKSNLKKRMYYKYYTIRSDGFQEVKVRIFILSKIKSGAPVMDIALTQFWSDFVKTTCSDLEEHRISQNFRFLHKIGPNSSNLLRLSK